MLSPLENYVPPEVPRTDIERRERCTAALIYMRKTWRLLEDAGVAEQFKGRMMNIATDIKAALCGKEKNGYDD